jgi:hypothetical protein
VAFITSWNARKLIAHVSGEVVRGMEAACQFAVQAAKGRTRHARIKRHLKYEIKVKGTEVVGWVGVEKSFETGQAGYIPIWLELGTSGRTRKSGGSTGRMAAQPYLRPAVFGHAKEILRLIGGGR